MLIDTKPQYFSDLVRIAGLSHGTDVWLGNAQTLLKEGKATISTAICTRDDIMIYLIQKGLESELAFTIMEKVRKGKGLTPEWEQIMKEHGVPDWYIWSCNKIQYMFPKAHAAAYVMMAWRVAYCKVFYPLAYYCAYFSIRADAFDYEKMAMGRERLEYYLDIYKAKKADGTIEKTELDEYKDMRIVQEMYAHKSCSSCSRSTRADRPPAAASPGDFCRAGIPFRRRTVPATVLPESRFHALHLPAGAARWGIWQGQAPASLLPCAPIHRRFERDPLRGKAFCSR